MCYEERYYSEWARRTARKRAEAHPTRERKPEAKPEPPKHEPARPKERELETV